MTEQTIQKMIALLKEHGWKIAAAESCTGGLLSAAITSAPGASEVFEGSIISYANRIKQALLGVDGQILDTCGAVSAPCAKAMASGVREKMGADIGVSVTGIAGPGGGTAPKTSGHCFYWRLNKRRPGPGFSQRISFYRQPGRNSAGQCGTGPRPSAGSH